MDWIALVPEEIEPDGDELNFNWRLYPWIYVCGSQVSNACDATTDGNGNSYSYSLDVTGLEGRYIVWLLANDGK